MRHTHIIIWVWIKEKNKIETNKQTKRKQYTQRVQWICRFTSDFAYAAYDDSFASRQEKNSDKETNWNEIALMRTLYKYNDFPIGICLFVFISFVINLPLSIANHIHIMKHETECTDMDLMFFLAWKWQRCNREQFINLFLRFESKREEEKKELPVTIFNFILNDMIRY